MKKSKTSQNENGQQELRDRIVNVEKMKVSELLDNQNNWRVHPKFQRDVLVELLAKYGKVGALLIYKSERNGGKWTILDGHLRKSVSPTEVWTTLQTDLNDEEADNILAFYDPVSMLAMNDRIKLAALFEKMKSHDGAIGKMMENMRLRFSFDIDPASCMVPTISGFDEAERSEARRLIIEFEDDSEIKKFTDFVGLQLIAKTVRYKFTKLSRIK
jgi:hypothetical protein